MLLAILNLYTITMVILILSIPLIGILRYIYRLDEYDIFFSFKQGIAVMGLFVYVIFSIYAVINCVFDHPVIITEFLVRKIHVDV